MIIFISFVVDSLFLYFLFLFSNFLGPGGLDRQCPGTRGAEAIAEPAERLPPHGLSVSVPAGRGDAR